MKEDFRLLIIVFFTLFILKISGASTPLLAFQDSVLFTLEWKAPEVKIHADGFEQKVLNHKDAFFMDDDHYIPFSQIIITDKLITDFLISKIEYEDLSDEESAIVQNINIKQIPHAGLQIKYHSKLPISYIYFPSIAIDSTNHQIRKVKSFMVHYKYEQINNHQIERTSGIRNSVLSTGEWYKFAVSEKGIYKITYEQLKKSGIPVDDIDPRNLKIFGNGGGMLPQKNNEFRHRDLVENAIYVANEADGKFSKEDYILFYGQGADKIKYDALQESFEYEKNIYSDSTYYFLTFNNDQGLRIGNQDNLGDSFTIIDYFDDYIIYEKDLINVNNSGREWYGEAFNYQKLSHNFKFPAEGIIENSEIKVICSFLTLSYVPSSYNISINDFDLGTVDLGTVMEGQYIERGVVSNNTFSLNSSLLNFLDNHLNVTLTYNRSTNLSSAYLDYLSFLIRKKLSLYNHQTFFRNIESTGNSNTTYKISNITPSSIIWDISDPLLPLNQNFSNINNAASFGVSTSELKEFVVFDKDHLLAPHFIEKVTNQNIQGEGSYDMVIVTNEKFKAEALRLAAFRSAHDHLSVKVTTVNEIYNEFSSGAKDVTAIRDYMKYLYDLDANGEGLKYLLLFGKGSYDIKNKIQSNINYVPIYGSRNSLHPIYSYSSDDYYGFLDDEEGEWIENTAGDHLMDIGIGRLPVRNEKEANLVVDKIIHYNTSPETFGGWRKDIYFVADDGDFNLHQLDADKLATLVDTAYADFNVKKIFVDSHPQIDKGNNVESAPEVNKAINDAIKSGSLIINYTGHGGINKWADEGILDNQMISKWKNQHKLPFFITATCTFGKHDDPIAQSGGEKMLLEIKGGAIGLITSSRPVFSSTNYALNLSFYNFVFKKVNEEYMTLGEIFKEVKNSSLKGSINRNFSLLGDPSMKLSYPKRNIEIIAINNRSLTAESDTLKALGKVNIKGKVTENYGSTIESFNGILYASIYDKLQATTTLGTPSMTFKERNSIIFRGKSSVVDGMFEFDFIVPKNISYDFNKGKVSLYAIDVEKNIDASGTNENIKIGGSESAVVDRNPPEVKLFLNDTTFRNGGVTTSNSLLLAKITDENGISIANNFNHQIKATLNNDQVYILNNYYEAEIDNYKVGWISYPIDDLPKGKNTIKLSVWDTHNNLSESSIDFYVEEDAKLSLNNVINYPNPFSEKTIFQFEHNAAGENLLVRIDIYSIKGEHVFSVENSIVSAPATINTIEWDGRNSNGQLIKEGIYIYKVSIISEASRLKNQKFKRLIFKN